MLMVQRLVTGWIMFPSSPPHHLFLHCVPSAREWLLPCLRQHTRFQHVTFLFRYEFCLWSAPTSRLTNCHETWDLYWRQWRCTQRSHTTCQFLHNDALTFYILVTFIFHSFSRWNVNPFSSPCLGWFGKVPPEILDISDRDALFRFWQVVLPEYAVLDCPH